MDVTTNQKRQLYEQLNIGIKVKATLETEGWKDIIHPNLENAIKRVVGGKFEDGWRKGKLNGKCKTDETISYYIGYKDALIDFYNEIEAAIRDSEQAKVILHEKDTKASRYINPYGKG